MFVGIALGALAVGLGMRFLTANVPTEQASSPRPLPPELAYVSQDAALIAFVDVRRVMASEFRRTLISSLPQPASGRVSFMDETGIDLYTDVDSLVAVVRSMSDTDRPLVLARGLFNPAPLERLVHEGAATAEEHAGVRVVTHGDVAVSHVTPGVALIGTPHAVRDAIDVAAARSGVAGHADVMRLVAGRHHESAWLIARVAGLADGFALPPEITSRIRPIQWLLASGDVTDGLQGVVRAQVRDDESAEDLRQVLAGVIAVGRFRGRRGSEIARTVDSLKLSLNGRMVSLAFRVSAPLVEELISLGGRRQAPTR